MKTIGWIGLGNMGFPMVLNLLALNHKVNIYTSNEQKKGIVREKGAYIANSLAELTQTSDTIFLMLPDDSACDNTLREIRASGASGKLVVNMSTVSPNASIRFKTKLQESNARYVEAPVSGSVKPATEGTLVILAAGKKEDVDNLSEYFDALGKKTFFLGETGKASLAKIIVNYYMSIIIAGLADAVLLAEKTGIADNQILDIINLSACASGMTQIKTHAIINRDFKPAFPLKYMYKDLKLSEEIGPASSLGSLMLELYGQANPTFGEEDLMAIFSYMEKQSTDTD